jgi:Mn-dependent DtxR family transcriptional regulator
VGRLRIEMLRKISMIRISKKRKIKLTKKGERIEWARLVAGMGR